MHSLRVDGSTRRQDYASKTKKTGRQAISETPDL